VHSTVKGLKGCVTVTSQLGKGSSFKLYFPATATDIQVKKQEQFPEHLKGTGRILLVDDEEIIRSAALDMLKRLGYEVVPAIDGRDAIEAYKRFDCKFDLVILDLVMPKMGGRDTFQIIRALEPSQKILLASGFIFGDDIEELLASGAIGFIQKPYRLTALSQKVHDALLKYYELDHMIC
jgi:CheY-like chemotaxis protein